MMAGPRADIRRLEERELFFLSQTCRIRQARGLVRGRDRAFVVTLRISPGQGAQGYDPKASGGVVRAV